MIITVKSIQPPRAGSDRSLVTTTDGQKFGCRGGVTAVLKPGASYEVATKEWEHEGRSYANITKATPAAAAPAAAPASSAPAAAPAQPFSTPKEIFVRDVVTAYIANGRCAPEKLTETLRYIIKAWDQNFGGASITGYQQAAE